MLENFTMRHHDIILDSGYHNAEKSVIRAVISGGGVTRTRELVVSRLQRPLQ